MRQKSGLLSQQYKNLLYLFESSSQLQFFCFVFKLIVQSLSSYTKPQILAGALGSQNQPGALTSNPRPGALKTCLHRDSDPDPGPDCLRL